MPFAKARVSLSRNSVSDSARIYRGVSQRAIARGGSFLKSRCESERVGVSQWVPPITIGSRWRTSATADYSRAAATFVAQRSTLFSVHPENSTRFPRIVTHIWYLFAEGIVIDISPDVRDAGRDQRRWERRRERERRVAFCTPACLPACVCARENAKNLTPNSLRGPRLFLHL